MFHSLLSCGKWWRARYSSAQEYPAARSHCLWYLDLHHIPIFPPPPHLLDHVRTRNLSAPVVKFTDWEWFRSLASELISPAIQINSGKEADKAANGLTAPIASVYRLSTSKITFADLNKDLSGLKNMLKHKQRLSKLRLSNPGTSM
jgi:hypothetical protein